MSPKNIIIGCTAAIILAAGASPRGEKTLDFVTKFECIKIPFKVSYEFDRGLGAGRMVKGHAGKNGYVKKLVQYEKKNGKLVSPKLIFAERKEPQNEVVLMGRAGWTSTRGSFTRTRVLTMNATGYSEEETSNCTRMGLRTGFGIVAVDPRTIRLGTRVFVEGYGFAIAGDTGGAIKGNRIDLCFSSRAIAMDFGRRKVIVHILE